MDGDNVKAFRDSLTAGYKGAVDYPIPPLYAKDEGQTLNALAQRLLKANVDILVAAGGRPASWPPKFLIPVTYQEFGRRQRPNSSWW